MNFSDIFKSSFLENVGSVSILDMIITLVLSFAIGLFIFMVYKKTYNGVMYSSSFGVTLIALTMITNVLILAVTSNVVLSLGMVGALSIVRFRTAIKEPLDIAFLFWSIAVGIILAAGFLPLAVIGSNGESLGIQKQETVMGYESKLFDTSKVHTIDIVMDDWDSFIETCTNEEYSLCSVVIDGEAYKNVAIRAKGNTSLTQVASYGNDRYSFKIEFDHYDDTKTYYGLDKLCLNNIIQDNTYMKDYLCYQLMGIFGVSSPLCSFVNISVNGETWGLYLAVEGVEEAFLERNY